MDEKIIDVKKFCEIMGGIHIVTAYRFAKSGMLPCVRIGRRIFFKMSDVQQFIKSKTTHT